MINITKQLAAFKNIVIYRRRRIKNQGELEFWAKELELYKKWYLGEIGELHGEKRPLESQKIKVGSLKDSAILTWGRIHQQAKYLRDLGLSMDSFSGMQLLDIGSGPIPSALAFENCTVHCLDPLLPEYLSVGFPLHYYERARFVHASSEDIPYPDQYFDAIISVNALDHVDDFARTVQEIRRVFKAGGKMRFHLHYHAPRLLEPIALDDNVVSQAFNWCPGFRKVNETKKKYCAQLPHGDEVYAVWSNF